MFPLRSLKYLLSGRILPGIQRHPDAFLSCLAILSCTLFYLAGPSSWRQAYNVDYLLQIQALENGRFFLDEDGSVLDRYPPIFPLALHALNGCADWVAMDRSLLILIAATLCILLSSLLLRRIALLTRAPAGPWFGPALLALHPFFLASTLRPLPVLPFTVFFLATLRDLLGALQSNAPGTKRLLFRSGVWLGISMLFWPISMLLPPLLCLFLLAFPRQLATVRRLGMAALLLLGTLLAIAPWESWVWWRSGQIIPLSTGGYPSIRDGFSFNQKSFRHPLQLPPAVATLSADMAAEYRDLNGTGKILGWLAAYGREHPLATGQTFLYKAGRAWYGTDSQSPTQERFNLVINLGLLIPALAGLFLRLRSGGDAAAWLFFLVVLYFWGMTTAVLSIVRYMLPVIALLLLYLPLGNRGAINFLRKRSPGTTTP